jgi:hypothetical protein
MVKFLSDIAFNFYAYTHAIVFANLFAPVTANLFAENKGKSQNDFNRGFFRTPQYKRVFDVFLARFGIRFRVFFTFSANKFAVTGANEFANTLARRF